MKYALTLFGMAVLAASLALPQSTPAKKAPASSKAAVKKGASAASKKGRPTKKAATVVRQMTPTPERYKEIQQALADKGYLKSEPNGVWDTSSTDALKQFQTDKNLPPSGKITAASLIGLGLGPKTGDARPPIPVDPAPAATN